MKKTTFILYSFIFLSASFISTARTESKGFFPFSRQKQSFFEKTNIIAPAKQQGVVRRFIGKGMRRAKRVVGLATRSSATIESKPTCNFKDIGEQTVQKTTFTQQRVKGQKSSNVQLTITLQNGQNVEVSLPKPEVRAMASACKTSGKLDEKCLADRMLEKGKKLDGSLVGTATDTVNSAAEKVIDTLFRQNKEDPSKKKIVLHMALDPQGAVAAKVQKEVEAQLAKKIKEEQQSATEKLANLANDKLESGFDMLDKFIPPMSGCGGDDNNSPLKKAKEKLSKQLDKFHEKKLNLFSTILSKLPDAALKSIFSGGSSFTGLAKGELDKLNLTGDKAKRLNKMMNFLWQIVESHKQKISAAEDKKSALKEIMKENKSIFSSMLPQEEMNKVRSYLEKAGPLHIESAIRQKLGCLNFKIRNTVTRTKCLQQDVADSAPIEDATLNFQKDSNTAIGDLSCNLTAETPDSGQLKGIEDLLGMMQVKAGETQNKLPTEAGKPYFYKGKNITSLGMKDGMALFKQADGKFLAMSIDHFHQHTLPATDDTKSSQFNDDDTDFPSKLEAGHSISFNGKTKKILRVTDDGKVLLPSKKEERKTAVPISSLLERGNGVVAFDMNKQEALTAKEAQRVQVAEVKTKEKEIEVGSVISGVSGGKGSPGETSSWIILEISDEGYYAVKAEEGKKGKKIYRFFKTEHMQKDKRSITIKDIKSTQGKPANWEDIKSKLKKSKKNWPRLEQ